MDFTEEQIEKARELNHDYWGEGGVFRVAEDSGAGLPLGHDLLWAYDLGRAEAEGWTPIQFEDIRAGMSVRVEWNAGDRVDAREGVVHECEDGYWATEGGWALGRDGDDIRWFVRTPAPRELTRDEAYALPAGARVETIHAHTVAPTLLWRHEGCTYRLISLPEPAHDPRLIAALTAAGLDDTQAANIAAAIDTAGLTVEPKPEEA